MTASGVPGRFRRRRAWGAALAALALAAAPGHAFAADYLDLSPEQLMSAEVISATKRAAPIGETPAAISIITQEDIARTGVTTIPDALRMVPGVDVAQGDSSSWAVNIRGFNKGLANQLLVMIDGRTIYNPLFGGTYWELQNLPMEDIERIEVVRGPGGTLWGANAVNGVINIITKSAADTQGTLFTEGIGTVERGFLTVQHGGETEGGGHYRVYAKQLYRGSFPRANNGGDNGDSWRDGRTGFRYDSAEKGGDGLMVQGAAYVNTANQKTSIPQLAPCCATTLPDDLQSRGADLLAKWRKGNWTIQSYADYTARDQVLLDDNRMVFDFDSQYDFDKAGAHNFTAGGGYRLVHDWLGNSPTLQFSPAVSSMSVFSAFAQDKIDLGLPGWFLTLGSKVEHNDYTGFELQPSARLQWTPDETQTAWAAVSRAVRTPTRIERDIDLNAADFAGAPPLQYELVANPDFRSEVLIAYEAGYRRQITPAVTGDISVFANDYSGLAAQQLVLFNPLVPAAGGVPAHSLLATTQANLMSAETYGFETAAEWNVSRSWRLSAGQGFLLMFLHLNNDFAGMQLQEKQSPRNQFNLRSYWNITEKLTLDTALYYTSRLDGFSVPASLRLDANFGWQIRPGLQFNLVGQNLLKAEHREFNAATDINAADIPRSVFGKFTCSF